MDLGIRGKTALVVAASKGIGKASALGLGAEGARVVMCARGEGALKDAAAEVKQKTGAEVLALPADASRAADIARKAPDEPHFFLKPTSALVGPDDPIVYPPICGRVEYGAELAVVMKRRCRNVPADRVRKYVLGYTCLNDVTAGDWQAKGLALRAKGFDTFCPLGPCIATDIDSDALAIETYVNGSLRQSSSTRELIFPIDEIVAQIAKVMTLLPGDVIATGTPAGAGALVPGDRIEVRIEGIGSLKNTVVKL